MAVLSKLPNELIIEIWGYILAPEDIESFALVTKHIYSLSTPYVREHAMLKQQFSTIHLWGDDLISPKRILQNMLQNPRIALYARELQITHSPASLWARRTPPSLSDFQEFLAMFEDALRCHSVIDPLGEVGNWIFSFRRGNLGPVIALVMIRLAKLRKLQISEGWYGGGTWVVQTMARIAIARSSKVVVRPGPSLLARDIDSSDPHIPLNIALFSNIRDLDIDTCTIDLDALSQLLRSIKELRSFKYTGYYSRFFSKLRASQILTELLRWSQPSLQRLHLLEDSATEGFVDDMTNFHNLTDLETDLFLLLHAEDESHSRRSLAEELPVSIETLTLHMRSTLSYKTLRQLVLRVVKFKMAMRLPKLKSFTIVTTRYSESDVMEAITELQKECAVGDIIFKSIHLLSTEQSF